MPNPPDVSTAALLIAHGSRLQTANDDLVRLARRVRERDAYGIVEIAYLELAEPTIPQGAQTCVERGARRVLMLPYFLSPGRHVSDDLEGFRREFCEQYPETEFIVCEPLGVHPSVVDVVMERLRKGEQCS